MNEGRSPTLRSMRRCGSGRSALTWEHSGGQPRSVAEVIPSKSPAPKAGWKGTLSHQHLFSPTIAALLAPWSSQGLTARDPVALLDSAGIRCAPVLSVAYMYGNPTRTVDDLNISAANAVLVARRVRQVGVERILYGSEAAAGGNLRPREGGAAFRRLPPTENEFERIARNLAPSSPLSAVTAGPGNVPS